MQFRGTLCGRHFLGLLRPFAMSIASSRMGLNGLVFRTDACSDRLRPSYTRALGRIPMTEITSNIEFAHRVSEYGHHHGFDSSPRLRWVEIAEALVLAIVAIATAWSGYQAAKWEALSAKNYALATRTTVRAQEIGRAHV